MRDTATALVVTLLSPLLLSLSLCSWVSLSLRGTLDPNLGTETGVTGVVAVLGPPILIPRLPPHWAEGGPEPGVGG